MERSFFKKAFVFLLLFQCALFSKEVALTEMDNGKKIDLTVGDTMTVRLKGNPTTGYTWQIAAITEKLLTYTEKRYSPSSSRCGAGGTYTFKFRAAEKGMGELTLAHLRTWEKGKQPINTFHITVTIS